MGGGVGHTKLLVGGGGHKKIWVVGVGIQKYGWWGWAHKNMGGGGGHTKIWVVGIQNYVKNSQAFLLFTF